VLKREKEVFGYLLDTEEAVMKELEKQYRKALEDIKTCIRIMQTDELTQSRINRINYQKTMKKQVEAILEKLHSDEYTSMQQYLSGTYTDAYVGTVYALHGQSVPVLMPIDQRAAAKAIITDSKISTDLYTHLGVDIKKLKKAIPNEITRGIASGMLFQDIARNIAFTTGTPLNRAKNIVQTEGHRIQQASAHDARHHAISRGADLVKQWDSTLDGATRDTHRRLDGQIREVDEPFEMDGKEAQFPGDFDDPSEDCRCRCVALSRARSALDAAELETMKERAKFWNLDKTKDFDDFKKKYIDAVKKAPEGKNPVQAKTIKEAADHAKTLGIKHVYYDDMPLEMANLMNQAIQTLPEGIRPEFVGMSKDIEQISRVPFGRSSKQYYGVSVEVMDMYFGNGIYDFDGGNMVGISSYYKTPAKITKAKQTAQEAYEKKYGRKWFFNEDGESTPFHEMGHVYANKKGLPKGFEDDAIRWAKESGCDMLKKPSEAWAEAWAAYHTQNPALPEYIRKYIKEASSSAAGKTIKNGLIGFEENGIIKKRIDEFSKDLKAGKISTKISKQKQARHVLGSKEYDVYSEKVAHYGDKPSYIREDLNIDSLQEMVKDKLGTGIIEVKNDNSIQEFFDCDDVIGYWYDKSKQEYVPTRRVQVKYALGNGNIHIIPVKESK